MNEEETRVEAPDEFDSTIAGRFGHRVQMSVPHRHNPALERLIRWVNQDDELYALWLVANVNAMERLGMTDHGPVHVKIVMNIAVKLLRLLVDRGIRPAVVRDYSLANTDAEVVVALGALFHDVGMSIHRTDHEDFSLFVAQRKLTDLLLELYEPRTAYVLRAEVLHAITAHRTGGKPLTLEAGIVRVADALDMAKGRTRIPFQEGSVSIHSLSAAAIDAVHIETGDAKPVRIVIDMSNSAGVFQVDQLFRHKLAGSGLEPYLELEAKVEGETEIRLLEGYRL